MPTAPATNALPFPLLSKSSTLAVSFSIHQKRGFLFSIQKNLYHPCFPVFSLFCDKAKTVLLPFISASSFTASCFPAPALLLPIRLSACPSSLWHIFLSSIWRLEKTFMKKREYQTAAKLQKAGSKPAKQKAVAPKRYRLCVKPVRYLSAKEPD